MFLINGITEDAKQNRGVILADGTIFTLNIEFKPQQLGWFITELTYGELTIQGLRICTSPNMIRQWKNRLPFGLSCVTNDTLEPTLQNAFSSGYASLFVLAAADVAQYEGYLIDQIQS